MTQAADIPRPGFHSGSNQGPQFFLYEPQDAQPLPRSKIETFIFTQAMQPCFETASNMDWLLAQITSSESGFTSAVRSLYPDFKISQLKDLRLLIDSFGSGTNHFRSFYLRPQPDISATISLDCSLISRLSWPALLSHETIHHLNHDRHLAPWVDEMLAQVTEIRAATAYPTARFETLRAQNVVPSFFARDKVFSSSQQYAVNMLFGLYLSQNFGSSDVFQLLTKDIQSLSDLARQVSAYTLGKHQFDWIRPFLTPRGLIRHFTLALNINLPTLNGGNIFRVPGWQNFKSDSEVQIPGAYYVEPGGSLRVSKKWAPLFANHDKNASWDIYRILKADDTSGAFKIQSPDEAITGKWSQNYLVLINGSETEYLKVELF